MLMPGRAGRRDANTVEETVEEEATVSSEATEVAEETGKVEACFIDPTTGQKECS